MTTTNKSNELDKILGNLAYEHAKNGYTSPDPDNVGVDYKLIDQAKAAILSLALNCLPEKEFGYSIDNDKAYIRKSKFNLAIDQTADNLRKVLK